MPKDDINYRFTENGVVYDFYDVFVPAENFRQPALWLWGRNFEGQLGNNVGVTAHRSAPVTTSSGGTNWKSIACGGYHTLAIKTDGTLWVWGRNNNGQLGINDTTNRNNPVTTILGGNNWKSISGGNTYTAAIKTDGTLWTWGNNTYGQLGVNDSSIRTTPVTTLLGGNTWKSIASKGYCLVATKTDGTLWTCGRNDSGQLGVNDTTNRLTPVTTLLGGNNWKFAAVGGRDYESNFVMAIKTDGTLWGWGLNSSGQLGVNNTTTRLTPVTTLLGGNTYKAIACGGYHTLAIKTDGTLWTWGSNFNGQLGTNDNTQRNTPVTTIFGGTNWKSISGATNYTTTLKTDGTIWTWGINNYGQLGVNDIVARSTPVTTLLGGNNWKSIASQGLEHVLAIQYTPDP